MDIRYSMQGQEPERGDNDYLNRAEPYTHNNPKRVDLEDINNFTLADYNLTPETVKTYMFGMTIKDPQTGKEMGDAFFNHVIEAAVEQAEQKFDIAILPRIRKEHHDYRSQEFRSNMYTHVYKRPIIQVEKLSMEMGSQTIRNFPTQWWRVYPLFGHIEILPSPGGARGSDELNLAFLAPQFPHVTTRQTFAPQMLHVEYVAGMLPRQRAGQSYEWEMPATLEKYIIKLAVKELIQVWGRLIVPPGIAGTTLSMDGISETVTTTQSAMYSSVSALLEETDQDIANLEEGLRSYFGGSFTSV